MTDPRYRSLPERRTAIPLACAGAVLLVTGLVLTWVVITGEVTMNARDLVINTWIRDFAVRWPFLDGLGNFFSWFADSDRNFFTIPIVIVMLLIFRQWRWAIFFFVAAEGGFLLSNVIKHFVGRERPPFLDFTGDALYTSFPSGHTFSGITVWVSISLLLFYLVPRPWSTVLGCVPLVIGLMNGPSRLLLGKHWISDVVGSWLLAGGWLLLSWAAFLWFIAPRPSEQVVEHA